MIYASTPTHTVTAILACMEGPVFPQRLAMSADVSLGLLETSVSLILRMSVSPSHVLMVALASTELVSMQLLALCELLRVHNQLWYLHVHELHLVFSRVL